MQTKITKPLSELSTGASFVRVGDAAGLYVKIPPVALADGSSAYVFRLDTNEVGSPAPSDLVIPVSTLVSVV